MDSFVGMQELEAQQDLLRNSLDLGFVQGTTKLQFLGKAPLAHEFHVDVEFAI